MSDNLRDRIAAVVSDHYIEDEGATWWRCICGQAFYIPEDSYRSCEEHVADAVIAELGLTRVTRSQNPPIHRYVTDWKANDA